MLEFLLSLTAGYKIAKVFSHPESKVRAMMPCFKIKFLQFLPNIKIYIRGKIIHIHHWIYLSLLLVLSFKLNFSILDSTLFRGILSGGIIQGLSFPDWKKIFFKEEKNA